ncbi:MAG TPA: glycosyl transferase [Bacteroidia bacterium]|nr:glycosyl transferase [Bacteroidia bacterium]
MYNLATFFDKNYLSRGIVLYNSLKKSAQNFCLYVLCLDDDTKLFFQQNKKLFPNIITLDIEEIEAYDTDLKNCKINRSKIEYYFTLSPCLPLYLMHQYQLNHICTLDTDILFLSDIEPIFNELKQYSIIITPHKFSKEIIASEKYGKYNVSFQIFKNDEIGLACLKKWRSECIDWCKDEYDEINDRFADQKYLDAWPNLYADKLLVLNDDVCGIAAWNLNNYTISSTNEQFYSNQKKIIFYHFHNFKILGKKWAAHGFNKYKVNANNQIHMLYLHYWNLLEAANPNSKNKTDISARVNLTGNLGDKLYNERYVYFKVSSRKIKFLDYHNLPNLIRKIIYKLNG